MARVGQRLRLGSCGRLDRLAPLADQLLSNIQEGKPSDALDMTVNREWSVLEGSGEVGAVHAVRTHWQARQDAQPAHLTTASRAMPLGRERLTPGSSADTAGSCAWGLGASGDEGGEASRVSCTPSLCASGRLAVTDVSVVVGFGLGLGWWAAAEAVHEPGRVVPVHPG